MLSFSEEQVTPDSETPNCLGEWGSELKLHYRAEVRLQRSHKCGQMFKELTQNAAGRLATGPRGSWYGLARKGHFPHLQCDTRLRPVLCSDTRALSSPGRHLTGLLALSSTSRVLHNSPGPLQTGCTQLRCRTGAPKGWRYPDVTKPTPPTLVAVESSRPPTPARRLYLLCLTSKYHPPGSPPGASYGGWRVMRPSGYTAGGFAHRPPNAVPV